MATKKRQREKYFSFRYIFFSWDHSLQLLHNIVGDDHFMLIVMIFLMVTDLKSLNLGKQWLRNVSCNNHMLLIHTYAAINILNYRCISLFHEMLWTERVFQLHSQLFWIELSTKLNREIVINPTLAAYKALRGNLSYK
jgi:hypothetical protein